ncbi:hypothetical protein ASE00_10555 [Sphingomonas sp. Root710]|uniref:hypothetical protein n=1 Tax=Sphingomonas sp. Root710 TaxID=1736594 RepID=UPI0006FDA6A9|nr:hypothetical protein [Sphingomonas sp. Root710]KRB82493.1 hypothetical protein ASE00_10555 [Sphingomonas sp. Root710]
MVWDLRGALLKKQEVETARLADFDFRLRARTMRLLAPIVGVDAVWLVGLIAESDDASILARLAESLRIPSADLARHHAACNVQARAELVDEIGDPTPHRLA